MIWRLDGLSTHPWNLVEQCELNSTHGCCPGEDGDWRCSRVKIGGCRVEGDVTTSVNEGGGGGDQLKMQQRYFLRYSLDTVEIQLATCHGSGSGILNPHPPQRFWITPLGWLSKTWKLCESSSSSKFQTASNPLPPPKTQTKDGWGGGNRFVLESKMTSFFFIKKKLEFWSHPKLRSQGPSVMDWLETMPREV